MVRPRIAPLALAVALVVTSAAPAWAQNPYDDYRQDGQIDPCRYSPQQLQNTDLPPDVLQYSPGLADQLNAGQEGCGSASNGTVDPRQTEAVPLPGGGTGGSGDAALAADGSLVAQQARVPDPPAPDPGTRERLADIATPAISATPGSDVPGWVVALLGAIACASLLVALIRFGGLSLERAVAPLRASMTEAGGRTADAMSQAWDTVRLGR